MGYIKFFGSRLGCKLNDIKFFKNLLPNNNDIEIICEPYAGSFALLRSFYKDTNKVMHVNDNDQLLIDMLSLVKNSPNDIINSINIWNEFVAVTEPSKIKYQKLKTLKVTNDIIKNYFMANYRIRGIYKKCPVDIPVFAEFVKKLTITNKDANDIFEQYKNNKKAFLFLDPPYLDSDNTTYKGQNKHSDDKRTLKDNTKIYIDCLNFIKAAKCKIMLIVNANAITEYLFKDFIKGYYTKIYQLTKNKTSHFVITNY